MPTLTRSALARPRVAVLSALALIVVFFGMLLAATPAAAHDALVGTTPSEGETVTAAPTSIGLEFSQEVLPEGTFAEVRGEDGADYADGTPTVEGAIVTIPLKAGAPNGLYTVNWQITSSDGHPTQGTWTFTLAAEQAPATEQAPDATATDAPVTTAPAPTATPSSAGAGSTSAPAASGAESSESGLQLGVGVVIGVIVIIAVVAVLVVLGLRRRAMRR